MARKNLIFIVIFAFCAFLFPSLIMGHAVHVLMPVYNTSSYLNKSLDSIFKQDYEDFCLIAYNDGSTDKSEDILCQYKETYPKQMILFGHKENHGISFARKTLLDKSFDINPDAMILWLDSDDAFTDENFVKIFVQQMIQSGADICLFNYDLVLEDDNQAMNLNGLNKSKLGYEIVLDTIWNSSSQALNADKIDNLKDITTLGWTKGYKKIDWPKPLNCPYEDFVYMAALYNVNKITALPSTYKPIQYLRRSNSVTGQRTEKTFEAVIAQLERFLHEVTPENRELHKAKILSFLKRKIAQYEELLENLVSSQDHPDITEKTLVEYRLRASKLLDFDNT